MYYIVVINSEDFILEIISYESKELYLEEYLKILKNPYKRSNIKILTHCQLLGD